MPYSPVQIAGLGNAIVDILADIDQEGPHRHGLNRGEMHLVDTDAATALYAEIGPGVQQSGGSVANTIAHIGGMGLKGTFLGKVADDDLGKTFTSEMADLGITCPVPLLKNDVGTGRSVIMVTPDGERTMSTYLGAAERLLPDDLPASLPAETKILLIEGYHFDAPTGVETISRAAGLAHAVGAKVALTPSDAGCIARHQDAMLSFVETDCDILIGNEAELAMLSGQEGVEYVLTWCLGYVETVALTRSAEGCLVTQGGAPIAVPAEPVEKVVDSTGAGDAFAAGFLGQLAQGDGIEDAAKAGATLAARVISHRGARQATTA